MSSIHGYLCRCAKRSVRTLLRRRDAVVAPWSGATRWRSHRGCYASSTQPPLPPRPARGRNTTTPRPSRLPDVALYSLFPLRAALPSTPLLPPESGAEAASTEVAKSDDDRNGNSCPCRVQPMAAAAPVAPGSGCLSRPRPRPPRVGGLRGAGVAAAAAEGPSCLYVGPIETASQEKLEALYHQARDSYYSGQPLIVDDMFDKVELKLRLYGSKSVVKYPRCSLIRQSTYADAEEDQSMCMALSSIWMLLLLFGTSAFLVPSLYTLSIAVGDVFGARHLLYGANSLDAITRVNDLALVGLGCLVGCPIASASVGALRGLLSNNLVALKGSCPNCGEQVFAFVKTDKSVRAPHRAECHVCQCPLEFRAKIEKSLSGPRRSCVYGRVYLVKQGHPRKRKWIYD